MKRTVLKILLAAVILFLIGGCVFLIWMAANGESTENREEVATWYSVKPYNNTITLTIMAPTHHCPGALRMALMR